MGDRNAKPGWFKRNGLTHDAIADNRWLRPFAGRIAHRELWRFTRRSVPRGVALGLLVGIFLLLPGVQIVGVALLSLPVRANIPIGAAMTFLSMPATTPFILAASLYVGNSMFHLGGDIGRFNALLDSNASLGEWFGWLVSEAAPAMISGLAVIAVVSASVGYVVASFGWRWWVARKWQRRRRKSI